MTTSADESISAIILAGGRGTRLGGRDKGLIELNDKPLIQHVIDRLSSQVDEIVISANRNVESYRQTGCRVVTDDREGFEGPLAGIHACLPHCRHPRILVIACDMPLIPTDLVQMLLPHAGDDNIAVVSVARREQPAFLFHAGLGYALTDALNAGERSLMQWLRAQNAVAIEFADVPAFANINDQNDLDRIKNLN